MGIKRTIKMIEKSAQEASIALTLIKELGLEGLEAASKQGASKALSEAAVQIADRASAKAIGALVELAPKAAIEVEQLITANAGKGAIGATADDIIKELSGRGITIAKPQVEKLLLNKEAFNILNKLSAQLATGSGEDALKSLTEEEAKCLSKTLLNVLKTGANNETKRAFLTLLSKSPTFAKNLAFERNVLRAFNILATSFKAITNPIDLLNKKTINCALLQGWMLQKSVGIITTLSTIGYLKNLFSHTMPTNLQETINTIITELKSYDFNDTRWTQLVSAIERQLNDGMKEFTDASTISIMGDNNQDSLRNKTKNYLTKISTGEDKLRRIFTYLAGSDFKNMFDIFEQAATSSTAIYRAKQVADFAEHMTPVDIRNITIVQDAAKQGINILNTHNSQVEAALHQIDGSMKEGEKPEQNTAKSEVAFEGSPSTTTTPQIKGHFHILNEFIKIAKLIQ